MAIDGRTKITLLCFPASPIGTVSLASRERRTKLRAIKLLCCLSVLYCILSNISYGTMPN